MKCPRCKNSLHPIKMNNISLDKCDTCMGIWFNEGELLPILKNNENALFTEIEKKFSKSAGIGKQELDSIELCPHCNATMTPVNYDYASGVIIDVCPKEHGVWLDAYELEKIIVFRQREKQKLAQLSPELIKKMQRVKTEIIQKEKNTPSSPLGFTKLVDAIINKFFN